MNKLLLILAALGLAAFLAVGSGGDTAGAVTPPPTPTPCADDEERQPDGSCKWIPPIEEPTPKTESPAPLPPCPDGKERTLKDGTCQVVAPLEEPTPTPVASSLDQPPTAPSVLPDTGGAPPRWWVDPAFRLRYNGVRERRQTMATDVIVVSYTVTRGVLTNLERVLEDLTPGTISYGKVILNASTFADEDWKDVENASEAIALVIKGLEDGRGEGENE